MKRNINRLRKVFREMETNEREERDQILKEHDKKWREIENRMHAICEKHTGHEFKDLPPNRWNRFDWNGNWPQSCWICGKDKVFENPPCLEYM
jgi:hypothetical protein